MEDASLGKHLAHTFQELARTIGEFHIPSCGPHGHMDQLA